MEPSKDDQLVATLESLRPAPSEEFAAELDERAAAGFPRRAGGGSPWRRFLDRLRTAEPRRLLLPAGGVAVVAIAVATVAMVATSGGGGSAALESTTSSASAGNAERRLGFERNPTAGANEKYDAAPSASSRASEEALAEPAEGEEAAEDLVETQAADPSLIPFSASRSSKSDPAYFDGSGPYAATAKHRDVERAAQMTLGTEPSEVSKAAGKVLGAVHDYDGIVLNSSVRGGSEGEAGAHFELLIPSANLSDALAAFSGIAEVRSRHESSNDITAPTVTTAEHLQDSHARIESLLNQLAAAETEVEQQAVEAKLRAERRRAARLKSQLSSLRRRANLSRVSLRIVSDEAPASGGGGGWNAGDALGEAGHILSVAAGVVIVALAVIAPLALIVLLVWLAQRAWLRGRRERALG